MRGAGRWYRGGHRPLPIRYVLTRAPAGKRQPTRPKAYLCTDPEVEPLRVLALVLHRWPIEVTCEEARAHVGVETQRQWSDRALLRETPCLFGLYSLVAVWGLARSHDQRVRMHQAAWYPKSAATFSDVLFAVRAHLWEAQGFRPSQASTDVTAIPPHLLSRLVWSACASP